MQYKEKPLEWIGSSKQDLGELPLDVRRFFGHRLWQIQIGKVPHESKPLFQLGHGIYELRDNYDTNTYRLMYVAHLESAVYVLDVFMKKSKSGIGLPQMDAERIKARFKVAHLEEKGK